MRLGTILVAEAPEAAPASPALRRRVELVLGPALVTIAILDMYGIPEAQIRVPADIFDRLLRSVEVR